MRNPAHCLLLIVIALSSIEQGWAVDPTVLWLPKSYSDARPLLLRVARSAEDNERCKLVIGGEMIVSKNTDDDYYFVITCRDALQRSYNMSYFVPRLGGAGELVTEQRSDKSAIKTGGLALDVNGLSKEQALEQCANSLAEKTILSGWTKVLDAQVAERELVPPWIYHFYYPFSAKNRLGQLVTFEASCVVDRDGISALKLGALHREQALEECYLGLEDEAILIGWTDLLYDQVLERSDKGDWAYRFNMPFNGKNRSGSLIRYNADCHVNEQAEAEVETHIDIEGIPALCLAALEKSSRKMLGVTLFPQEIESVEELEYEFHTSIPFDALNPSGKTLHYSGVCVVNDAGRSRIKIVPR